MANQPHKPAPVIQVTATYLPARKPAQLDFSADTTLADVKAAILAEFKVVEGPAPDGQSQIVFQIYDDQQQLSDFSVTIGAIAAPGHHATLKLVKQIIQG